MSRTLRPPDRPSFFIRIPQVFQESYAIGMVIDVQPVLDVDTSAVEHFMCNRTGPVEQMVMERGLQDG